MAKDRLEKRLVRRWNFFKFCLFTIIIGAIVIFAMRSNYFNIKDIQVQNNNYITKEEVTSLSELKGENIFFMDKAEASDKIFNNPYVESVTIKRKLPSTIIIGIKEKEIKGIIKYQNSYINIDKDGKMVQVVNKFPDGKLPVIEGIVVKQYKPDEKLAQGDEVKETSLKYALSVTDYKEFKEKISVIDITDPYNIILKTKNGIDIKLGDWIDIEYKLSFVIPILDNPELKNSKGYIEVYSDGTAIFKKYK